MLIRNYERTQTPIVKGVDTFIRPFLFVGTELEGRIIKHPTEVWVTGRVVRVTDDDEVLVRVLFVGRERQDVWFRFDEVNLIDDD
jgi:hypothetical protein